MTHHLSHHTTLCHTPSFTHHLSHAIFHTPLCHTPSFTHNFVTHHLSPHHLSHTTLSHTIFHTQLCHTLSFTHNFHTQLCHTHTHHLSLSHTIFHIQLCHTQLVFTSRSSTTSFVFPSFPVPLQHLLLIVGRSWLVGLSGPLICVFVCLFLCSLLFWWHHTGLMLNHVEPLWVIFRYLLAFFFGLGHFSVVEFWSCWLLFWTWAFQCC